MKVGIDMGATTNGTAAMLDLEELLATRLLVQGNSGSGKSHLLRRLLEQSAPWVQQCIIDPEGDFVTLADKFGHVVIDGERTEAELIGIANSLAGIRERVALLGGTCDIFSRKRVKRAKGKQTGHSRGSGNGACAAGKIIERTSEVSMSAGRTSAARAMPGHAHRLARGREMSVRRV